VREKNFFPFSSGLFFFFFFIRKEKKRKRGEKRSILAPLFSPIWGFSSFFFILFFGFARMCRLFYPREEIPADPSSTLGLGCIYYLGCAVGVRLVVAEKEREEGPRLR
jgi:amino acid transporter